MLTMLCFMLSLSLSTGTGLYSGCGALVSGNAVKAAVRFFSYDKFKTMLVNDDGKLTAPRSLLAGLLAGSTECVQDLWFCVQKQTADVPITEPSLL